MSRSGQFKNWAKQGEEISLNPSFSGCPALGTITPVWKENRLVLIPLLVDVPLWALYEIDLHEDEQLS